VEEDGLHAERVGDETGVLPARAAETAQHIAAHVVSALHGNLLDRLRHVLDGDADEAVRRFFRREAEPARDVGELPPHDVGVERRIAVRTEDMREKVGKELPGHHIRVGDGERSAAPVAGRARIGAGGVGADAKPQPVRMEDRAAARRDRVDLHHRRAHAHAGHLRLEASLELAVIVADIGGGAAHVEADDALEAGDPARLDRADHAARRAGEDRVLPLEEFRIGEPARGLHEEEPRAVLLGAERRRDAADIAREDRREIGVDHGRVAARDEFHQRAHMMARRNLREADLARDLRRAPLMRRITIAVHEADRDRAQPGGMSLAECAPRAVLVEGPEHATFGAHPLVDLGDAREQHRRLLDLQAEEVRPVLIADAQRVGEAPRREEEGRLALALEKRIGRDRRSHLHRADAVGGEGVGRCDAQKFADALQRRVLVALRIFGKKLLREKQPLRRAGDDVGEGTAPVDPEVPAIGHGEIVARRSEARPGTGGGLGRYRERSSSQRLVHHD